jgi:putative hydrolase of the HAD superfamily
VSAHAFREAIAEALGKSAPPEEQFDAAFSSIIGFFILENVAKIAALRGKLRLFLLSNTNERHAPVFERLFERECPKHSPFRHFFEFAHYSHELGERKPDVAAFTSVLTRHDLRPERVVFIDDNLINIESARAARLQTLHTPMNSPLPAFRF